MQQQHSSRSSSKSSTMAMTMAYIETISSAGGLDRVAVHNETFDNIHSCDSLRIFAN
eukprot:m.360394 g.360394  ORF g.360394 m.360394 type:complete len:57 (-) comp20769_c0_seq9:486-656(-)